MPRIRDMLFRLLPVSSSTRALWGASLDKKETSFTKALHGYIYFRWPIQYIGLGLGRGKAGRLVHSALYRMVRFFRLWSEASGKSFADTYHGKVMTPGQIRRLIAVGRPLHLEVPEQVLPYGLARAIFLDHPDSLALFECPCRATVPSPCLPLDVCIIVGQPFVDFVLEHHPKKSRPITVEEAQTVVEAAHARGHVTHAFFKEAALGRYYAVCNCCSCCCGAMQAHRQGIPMLASSGFVCTVDNTRCIGCGECVRACPFAALRLAPAQTGDQRRSAASGGLGNSQTAGNSAAAPLSPGRFRNAQVDTHHCLGCGVCIAKCPKNALHLELDPAKPAPLEV